MAGGAPSGTGTDPGWQTVASMNAQSLALQNGPLQAAQQRQIQAIQSGLSSQTLDLVKMFGDRLSGSGASLNAPFTSSAGGMSPLLTPGFSLVGVRG